MAIFSPKFQCYKATKPALGLKLLFASFAILLQLTKIVKPESSN